MSQRASLFVLIALPISLSAQFGNRVIAYDTDPSGSLSVMLADLDSDGDNDALTSDPQGLYSWSNDGAGNFSSSTTIGTGFVGTVFLADVDQDGDTDLMAAGDQWPGASDLGWYANDGAGNFTPMSQIVPSLTTSAGGGIGDLDQDGDVDLVFKQGAYLKIVSNDGVGNFTIGADLGPFGTGGDIYTVINDVDGDGDNDILAFGTAAQRGLYVNQGAGVFAAPVAINGAGTGNYTTLWDAENDGDTDILLGAMWLLNDGTGAFLNGDTLGNGAGGHAADPDNDGDPDFFSGNTFDLNVWHSRNDGSAFTSFQVEQVQCYSLQGVRCATGDIDGDADVDLLVGNGCGMLGWYAGDGANNWSVRRNIGEVLTWPHDGVPADLDLDGDVDMTSVGYHDDRFAWYANDGSGMLGSQLVIADNMNGPEDIEVMDLELDGDSDLVLFNKLASTVVRAWNNGAGQFTVDSIAVQPAPLARASLDSDPYPDLVAGDSWYLNDGNGNFLPQQDLGLSAAVAVACGDMDGDQTQDIVLVTNQFNVITNISGASFTSATSAGTPSRIALADVDMDGDLDVIGLSGGSTQYWYANDGFGALTPQTWATGVPTSPWALAVTDVNDDGAPDINWTRNAGYLHELYYVLNNGNGTFGPVTLSAAFGNAAIGFADMNGDLVDDLYSVDPGSISWQENLFYNAFRLRGAVFKDYDSDGVFDPTDVSVPFQLVRTDANNLLLWTNSDGNYDLPADTGTWSVWSTPPPAFQVVNSPDTLTATLTAQQPIADGLNFGWVPIVQDSTGFISLTTDGNFDNCNQASVVWLHVTNTGTFIPEDFTVQLYVHPDITVNAVSVPPDSIAADIYYWHVDSLGWFQQWNVVFDITLGPAGSSNAMIATATFSQAPSLSFTSVIGLGVDCSYDPNDKLVTPAGYGPAGAVDIATEWLEYTIRFQNTGTDTAFTVLLRDTLDADLEWESLQVLVASHDLTQITVDANGEALFRFQNILLPDSNASEPESHGFVKYRLRPDAGAAHLTEIHNTAAIHFDFNEPVITNTVLNTLVDCGLHQATVFDQGAGSLSASTGALYQWFLNGVLLPGDTLLALQALVNGDYSVQVTTEYGCVDLSDPYTYLGMATSARDDAHLEVTPNPASDRLVITSGTPLTNAHRIALLDVQGRNVLSVVGNGSRRVVIERGMLTAGTYLLSVAGEEGVRMSKVVLE